MKAYVTTSGQVTGVFPATVAKNSSTGAATDGTPILADYTNDMWPVMQGLMDRCAMTPSGSVEAYVAVGSGSLVGVGALTGVATAQHLLSLAYNYGAPGEIVFDFVQGVNALPATRRVMALQGQNIDGFLYPDLWYNTWCGAAANAAAVYFFTSSSSSATYATASAARSTTGLTVNGVTGGRYLFLPDLRGLSPVMVGTNGSPTGIAGYAAANATAFSAGTALGAVLADMLQGHYHQTWVSEGGGSALPLGSGGPLQGSVYSYTPLSASNPPITDGTNGTPRKGAETAGAYMLVKKWRRTA